MNAPEGEETIFAEALRLPAEERAAYLAQAAGGDAELRRRIESLLGSYQAGDFLDEAAAPQLRQTLHVTVPLTEKPGDTIGRYKLLQQIGEGGCGVVYMAEQTEPLRRRVALKIIKLGMDTKSVTARFEAERQALAMMDHPNIAKVFDAGATEAGRPYFVMELVRGMKITEYCDEKKLSTRERLDLFIQLCHAIQHAHQKGIIHRDIKPSNILVSVNDGVPVPKVIDFGIAKATSGQQLTDKTIYTAFEQFIGTPAYMSPEQTVLTSLDIDTRSDIYALGVLLYELLTGKTPFDAKELLAIGLDEMRRTIREQEPPRPSTRLSTLPGQELSTTAQRRGLDAPKLVSELRSDLDWIVMKALEKDRARRYETANGLAADVQRHLNNEPVMACPPSRLYRLQKTVRRNKLVFAAAGAVFVALLFGLCVSSWMYFRERQARARAVAAERTERELRREAELRKADTRAHEVAWSATQTEEAIRARRQAIDVQSRYLGPDHPDVAESLGQLAMLLSEAKHFSDAEKASREGVTILRKHSPGADPKLARSLLALSSILREAKKYSDAEDAGREAVEIRRKLYGDDSVELAQALNDLAVSLNRQSKTADAAPLYREAFAIVRKHFRDGDPNLGRVGHNVLRAFIDLGQLSEASAFARDFLPRNDGEAELPDELARLARHLFDAGQPANALRLLDDIVAQAPGSRALVRVRGEFHARHGHWKEAVNDFIHVVESKRREPGRSAYYDDDSHKLAVLLVQVGDKEAYRRHCRYGLEHSGSTSDVKTAHRLAKDSLVLPDAQVDLDVVGRLAELCVSGEQKWGAYGATKSLADYRRGRFASAAEWAEGTIAHEARANWVTVESAATLAMALQGLNQHQQALAALKRAREDAEAKLPRLDSNQIGSGFIDVIISYALLQEATELIEGSSTRTLTAGE